MNPAQVVVEGRLRPDGTLELDDKVALPPGPVRVTVELVSPVRTPSEPRSTLAERFKGVIGIVSDLPPDMAEHHDHYIHGTPN
jgi:hypothetical protein